MDRRGWRIYRRSGGVRADIENVASGRAVRVDYARLPDSYPGRKSPRRKIRVVATGVNSRQAAAAPGNSRPLSGRRSDAVE